MVKWDGSKIVLYTRILGILSTTFLPCIIWTPSRKKRIPIHLLDIHDTLDKYAFDFNQAI